MQHDERPPNGSTWKPTRLDGGAVRLQRLQLLVGELDRLGQQQPLARRAAAGELRHHLLEQHPLVGRVLVHDHEAVGPLEDDVGVEELRDRRGEGRGARASASAATESVAVGFGRRLPASLIQRLES